MEFTADERKLTGLASSKDSRPDLRPPNLIVNQVPATDFILQSVVSLSA
jgi:hypothetical protein